MKMNNYFIILMLLSFFLSISLFASESENAEKKLLDKEKIIDVQKPIDIKKLNKDVKNEDDAKNAVNKGTGEKGGSNTNDPHNFKDVKDNKIDAQNINNKDKDDIDPNKFMLGLGDNTKKKNGKDDKKVIINPNFKGDPFNDKKNVQNIYNKLNFKGIDIYGNLGVRINFRDDDSSLGSTLFELQTKFDLSFEKNFTNSSFKITFGTIDYNSINNDWVTTSTVEANYIPIGLKQAYYVYKNFANIKMGRFFSNFESNYFFSKYLNFDGIQICGQIKSTNIYYKLLVTVLQSKNIFTDSIDIAGLSTFDLGYKNDDFNIDFYYSFLSGKDLNTVFKNLEGNKYSQNNHYLAGNTSYKLNINKDNILNISLDGSYNFSADEDRFGLSLTLTHESNTFISKLTLLYKQKNSVISQLTLQDDFFTSDIMGGHFKFMYKYDEAMSSGVEFLLGKSINNENSDLVYITRAVYNINF